MKALRERGHTVCVIGTTARPPGGHTRITPGTPDLFVSPVSTANDWRGLEVKRPYKYQLRPEQLRLWTAGKTAIVTNLEQALDAVESQCRATHTISPAAPPTI